jgi:hypothetical protein
MAGNGRTRTDAGGFQDSTLLTFRVTRVRSLGDNARQPKRASNQATGTLMSESITAALLISFARFAMMWSSSEIRSVTDSIAELRIQPTARSR